MVEWGVIAVRGLPLLGDVLAKFLQAWKQEGHGIVAPASKVVACEPCTRSDECHESQSLSCRVYNMKED